jgi:hypothetical protein
VSVVAEGEAAADLTLDPARVDFTDLPPGQSTTVTFVATHGDPAFVPADGGTTATLTATTEAGELTAAEPLTLGVVPTAVIPELRAAPDMGTASDDIGGAALDISHVWEGAACAGSDCGAGSRASVGWAADETGQPALYLAAQVADDRAGAAATPERCFGHWLVDSLEWLLDPSGRSQNTSTTFKLGVFPYTDDPADFNGNGPDGACWSRDADNNQGFSTGPLSVHNAEGVRVVADAARAADGTYEAGAWRVKVKVPFAVLPGSVTTSAPPTGQRASNALDPSYLGMNITPYDSDQANFIGETRTAWSAYGSQQSEPARWGHAYLQGYTSPAMTVPQPRIPDTALRGVQSPQSIYQSAVRGVPIAGAEPSRALTITRASLAADGVALNVAASAAGTLRVYVWKGEAAFVPVYTSSCAVTDGYGFDACSAADGAAPDWGSDMGGRVLASADFAVASGSSAVEVPLGAAARAQLGTDVVVLASWQESAPASGHDGDGVAAWMYPVIAGPDQPDKPDQPGWPGGSDGGTAGGTGDGGQPGAGAGGAPTVGVPSPEATVTFRAGSGRPVRYGATFRVQVATSLENATRAVISRGNKVIGTVPLQGGRGSARLTARLAPGSHVLTAEVRAGEDLAAATATLRVVKAVAKVTAKAGRTATSGRAKVRVTVALAAGQARITGRIVVKDGGKVVARAAIKSAKATSAKASVTITLPKVRASGKHRLTLVYRGNTHIARAKAVGTTLTIR